MKYLKELAELYRTLDLVNLNIETNELDMAVRLLLQLRFQIAQIFKNIESNESNN